MKGKLHVNTGKPHRVGKEGIDKSKEDIATGSRVIGIKAQGKARQGDEIFSGQWVREKREGRTGYKVAN